MFDTQTLGCACACGLLVFCLCGCLFSPQGVPTHRLEWQISPGSLHLTGLQARLLFARSGSAELFIYLESP